MFCFVVALTGFSTMTALAQSNTAIAPQITQAVDPTVRHTLAHSVPARLRAAVDQGRASASLPMKDILLRLKPSAAQTKALTQFMADVQNPQSASYHKWVTPAEFGAKFGVADADVQTVSNWLTTNGFTISEVALSKGWIRFSGSSAQVERAFGTEIHGYTLAGAKQYSNATELSIPSALAPAVEGLVSLNSFTKAPQHTKPAQLSRSANGKMLRTDEKTTAAQIAAGVAAGTNSNLLVHPNFTSQGLPEETFLAPGDFAKIYNTTPLIAAGTDGTGVSIAIVGRSDISLSDVEAFRTIFNLPYNDPTFIHANDDPGVVGGDDEEAALDVEWSGAVAPKAKINYVIGGSTYSTDGVDISASYIVDNLVAPIMSLSFGECEQAIPQPELDFYRDLWQQASAEGISVLISSGDAGSSTCDVPSEYLATTHGLGVNGIASTPYDTAVGGTEFADADPNAYWNQTINADQSSVKGYVPEAVWNEACNPNIPVTSSNCFYSTTNEGTYAGGGGASNCSVHPDGDTSPSILSGLFDCASGYAKPSWQTGPGVPQDGARDVPDVALAAAGGHDGYLLCYNGSCQWSVNSDGSVSLQSASIIGGTSAASPSMAGIMALVEQKNGTFQGLANYQLYKLAAQQTGSCDSSAQTDPTQSNSCVFHDVTSGSNALSCLFGTTDCTVAIDGNTDFGYLTGFSAGAGYDPASGLGSVNAANLVAAWGSTAMLPTGTTLTVSKTTFAHGTPIDVASVVSPGTGSGVPSGDIILKAAGTNVTTAPIVAGTLTAGQYAASLISLPGGTYNLTSTYGGDGTYGSSTSAPVALTVTPDDSVLTPGTFVPSRFFILGRQPIVPGTATALGNNFFVQVAVAGNSQGGIPTGTVALSTGATPFGTYTLDQTGSIYIPCGPGTACDLGLGNYTFTATYSGDSSFNTSTTTFPFTVTKGKLKYGIGLSSQTPPTGSTVIANVYFEYDPVAIPTGTVTLTRDDTGDVLATGTIGSDGTALIPFVAAAGDYDVIPSWAGDSNYTPGVVFSYEELITTGNGLIPTTTTMATSTTASVGTRTQVNVTVTPSTTTSAAPIASGTVTLHTSDGGQAAPVTLVAGHAVFYVPWNGAGIEKMYATYDGDANFNGSASALATITISQATPTLQLSTTSAYVAAGGQISVTAFVVSPFSASQATTPTGTVQFYDSVGGAAAVAIGFPQPLNTGNKGSTIAVLAPVLAAGTHSITATYSGDTNWTAATSGAVAIDATTPDFSATATPNPLTLSAGQTAAVSITSQSILGYDAAITVSCGTLPVGVSCNSAQIVPGATGSITLSSIAPGTTTVTAALDSRKAFTTYASISIAGLLLLVLPKRRSHMKLLSAFLVAGIVGSLMGCGGSSSPTSTSLSLVSSATKVASGSSVMLQATASSEKKLTGSVTFYADGSALGKSSLINGVATLSSTSMAVGTHAITAKYSGDEDNAASTSADTVEQTITGAFTLTLNATSGSLNHSIAVPAQLQ